MKRTEKGRGLFYTRDSGGKHENTPGEYVGWAQRAATDLGVSFSGTPEAIEAMIRDGRYASGNLYLDYVVKGNVLSRDGLNALIEEALRDPEVTHIFIPRRDRLARPDHAMDGVKLENLLRMSGITLVFMDKTCPPLAKGKRQDIADLLGAVIDYDRSGKDRRDLAQKIIYAQIRLTKLGYSAGGRAPYGFCRWLVREDGTRVRQLTDGEYVRMAGHHVVWLPGSEEEQSVIRRILRMLETMPASRVAAILTAEGVPPPDSGRCRTDHGIRHATADIWHQTTIVGIARNPLLLAMCSYGRRSMGDQLRFTPTGPRELRETDFRADEKPKVIRNAESDQILAPAKCPLTVEPERHKRLLATLDARGGTQRGKARSHDPTKNPLGARIFDMNCTWPMYRIPYGQSFRYGCGFYLQSHGQRCAHNYVDGPTAVRFALGCMRQRLLSPTLLPKLERRLRELALHEADAGEAEQTVAHLRAKQAQVRADLATVTRNMALAATSEQYKAIATTFDELNGREAALEREISEAESQTRQTEDVESKVAAALDLAHRLTDLVADPGRLDLATQAFQVTDTRLFLSFRPVQVKKRILNKITGGSVTFGATPPPIEIYRGPTGRRALGSNRSTALVAAESGKLGLPTPPEDTIDSGLEGKSLRNVSRGDWI